LGIRVLRNSSVTDISRLSGADEKTVGMWSVQTIRNTYTAKKILVATGSNPKIWGLLQEMGHTIVSPVPSLFTFNIKDDRIAGIPGVSSRARISIVPGPSNLERFNDALKKYSISRADLESEGPLLITHWGMSGPGILRLSAWGALLLNDLNYRFAIHVNWLPDFHEGAVLEQLRQVREVEGKKTVLRTKCFDLPKRLWMSLVKASDIGDADKWAEVSKTQLQGLAKVLTTSRFHVNGKSTFKEEFVTAGGVDLREIDFKTYESKILPDLFFAGEILNIDAITGGFNFQNAWTGAYIAAQAIVKK
ncbi:MAG TPA: aminoacetone oxidase family FAD-binding enzyme, partial [Arenibacter sp.]|nr:aminoacetone oxidase family FAD-binding enzyme [Arenibacter sp.]